MVKFILGLSLPQEKGAACGLAESWGGSSSSSSSVRTVQPPLLAHPHFYTMRPYY